MEDELSFNKAVRVVCDHGIAEVDKLLEDESDSQLSLLYQAMP